MERNRCKIMLWFICLLTVTCTSEELEFIDDDDVGSEYHANSQALCKQPWVNIYQDDAGKRYTKKLEFDIGRSGKESLIIKFTDGVTLTAIGYFMWHWTNEQQNALQIVYSSIDIVYFTDVRIQEDVLHLFSEEDKSAMTYWVE